MAGAAEPPELVLATCRVYEGETLAPGDGTTKVRTLLPESEQAALLRDLLAPGLGVTADDVPDLGALLVGPLARGATVSLGEPTATGGSAS